jgi:hypothetical protein
LCAIVRRRYETHTHLRPRTHARTHAHTHTHKHTRTHAHTHTHTLAETLTGSVAVPATNNTTMDLQVILTSSCIPTGMRELSSNNYSKLTTVQGVYLCVCVRACAQSSPLCKMLVHTTVPVARIHTNAHGHADAHARHRCLGLQAQDQGDHDHSQVQNLQQDCRRASKAGIVVMYLPPHVRGQQHGQCQWPGSPSEKSVCGDCAECRVSTAAYTSVKRDLY